MNPYSGQSLDTLTEALEIAQAALPKLSRGELVGSIATGDKRISFVATTSQALQEDIAYLQAAIAAASGSSTRRKGVYLIGGKGL